MEGYFHVSFSPVPRVQNDFVTDKSANKTSSRTGKPIGFWYALTLDWLPILDRNYGKGIGNAVRMSLGIQNVVNKADENEMDRIYPGKVYVYSLNILDAMKTMDIHHPNPNIILQLTEDNLDGFIEVLYIPYATRERTIKLIQTYYMGIFYKGEDIEASLNTYFETIEQPRKNVRWYTEYTKLNVNDPEEYDEFITENQDKIIKWLNTSIERIYDAKRDELFGLETEIPTFIEGHMWANFWKDVITPRFGGVEFTDSVINLEGGPIWSRFLEIPSGCLFRPKAMGVEMNRIRQLSLDPANNTREMNVFGKLRNNGTVKRVHAMPGGSRRTLKKRIRK